MTMHCNGEFPYLILGLEMSLLSLVLDCLAQTLLVSVPCLGQQLSSQRT